MINELETAKKYNGYISTKMLDVNMKMNNLRFSKTQASPEVQAILHEICNSIDFVVAVQELIIKTLNK